MTDLNLETKTGNDVVIPDLTNEQHFILLTMDMDNGENTVTLVGLTINEAYNSLVELLGALNA